jgi:hypothetical protein
MDPDPHLNFCLDLDPKKTSADPQYLFKVLLLFFTTNSFEYSYAKGKFNTKTKL